MATAVSVTIAEAVKTDLNAASFSQSFTATREALPFRELRQLKALTVIVAPTGRQSNATSRAASNRLYFIDIGVLKKINVSDNDEVDPLILLVEEIANEFEGKPLPSYTTAKCTNVETLPAQRLYDWEFMEKFRQFTAVVRLTFKLIARR